MLNTRSFWLTATTIWLLLSVALFQGCESGSGKTSSEGYGGSGGLFSSSGSGGSGGINTGTGGSTSGVGGGCAETTSEAMEGALPADIIIAVDNSGSMTEEAVMVQNSMNAFANIIIGSGIDAHIVMISADSTEDEGICVPPPLGSGACPNDESLPVYRHVVQPVASSNSLELIIQTYDQWQSSLRPGATKTLAVISDDNSAMDAATFTQQLLALSADFQGFKFDAIVAFYEVAPFVCETCPVDQNQCKQCDLCCGLMTSGPWPMCVSLPAEAGTVYVDLALQTGGVLGNLCIQDFLPMFNDMATAVVASAQIACVYDIPDPSEGETIDFGKVNVDFYPNESAPPQPIYHVPGGAADCGPEGGWYYDNPASPTQILFCAATCALVQASQSGKVVVKFGCETLIGPPA